MSRTSALRAADEAVDGRDDVHGDPRQNFRLIADLWTCYLERTTFPLDPHEVAELMALLKIARSVNGRPAFDHYVDVCGYATLGAHLSPEGDDD